MHYCSYDKNNDGIFTITYGGKEQAFQIKPNQEKNSFFVFLKYNIVVWLGQRHGMTWHG